MPGVTPTPRGLILDLLSTLRGDAMPVRALVAAGELFGLGENPLRVALARLLAAGTVERDERGSYRLGPPGAAVKRHVVAWKSGEERVVAWRGGWLAAHTGRKRAERRDGDRAERRREARALGWLGFRPLFPSIEVRPDNLAGGVEAVRERLRDLGARHDLPLFTARDFDAATESRAHALWDVAALGRAYAQARARLESSMARLDRLSPRAALVESFSVGGAAIRLLALDPVLPDELLPGRERRALAIALGEYDRRGRRHWSEFMRGFGLSRTRTLLERRVSDTAGWLAASEEATT